MKLNIHEAILSSFREAREAAQQWSLDAGERQVFSRAIAYQNVTRFRTLCLLVAIIEAMALILTSFGQMQYGAGSLSGRAIVVFLAANVAVSLAFYLGVRRPAAPSGLRPWHHPALLGTVISILSLFALISVFRQAAGSGISPFMIALLVCAAGLCLCPWESAMTFGVSFGVLLTSFAVYQPGDFRFPVVFNNLALVLFAYFVSFTVYQKEKRDFRRKRLPEATTKSCDSRR